MLLRLRLCLCLCASALGQERERTEAPEAPGAPEATVAQGRMRGSVLRSRLDRPIYAFRGIPYARPPLGPLRFQAPLPAGPWPGLLDASKDGSDCLQRNYLQAPEYPVSGSEDCLFLNVYTARMSPPFELQPVMVYIHGGGFFAGSGTSGLLGPHYLLDHGVVLVTVNYRLGALGFLSTCGPEAPGNAGLKDQSLALRWVRDNIAAFGGDPGRVTLLGQSAGAASVHLHLLSPLSRGLLHRAVSQSGWALSGWAVPTDPRPVARAQARLVGCPEAPAAATVRCLQRAPAERLVRSGHRLHYWSVDPLTVYRPAVEPPGPGAFLPAAPLALMQAAAFQPLPWLTGTVDQEGAVRVLPIVANGSELAELNQRWDELLPRLLELELSAPPAARPALWRQVSSFYFGRDRGAAINGSHFQPLVDAVGDRGFLHPLLLTLRLHSRAGHRPIFLYRFSYRGNHSFSQLLGGGAADLGACHGDELLYLFRSELLFPPPEPASADGRLLDALARLWTDFAKFGDPTPSGESPALTGGGDCESRWLPLPPGPLPPSAAAPLQHLHVSGPAPRLCLRAAPLQPARMRLWDSLPLAESRPAPLPLRLLALLWGFAG